jgi:hypothetical protein
LWTSERSQRTQLSRPLLHHRQREVGVPASVDADEAVRAEHEFNASPEHDLHDITAKLEEVSEAERIITRAMSIEADR